MADFGVCGSHAGTIKRPCKISHSSTYPNQVGVYPSEFLPSTFTIWHAVFASNFPPALPDTGGLEGIPIGAGLLSGLIVGGAFDLTGVRQHNWQSHHYIIFARTANRFNVKYVLSETDIENLDASGVLEIDVGEYIFEVAAVTNQEIDISNTLSDQEIEDLEAAEECNDQCTFESQDDREFRKLFEIPLKNAANEELENLFLSIVPNARGTEYRMDNGTQKSKLGLNQAGLGDLDNPSNRDGTSRKIKVKIKSFDTEGEETKDSLAEGQTIWLHYVAVKEHYMRQRVNISWITIDPGDSDFLPCISDALGFSITHFRFYEWDMEPETPGGVPQRLAGWRAVEAFSSDVNFVAPITINNQTVLADFVMGAPDNQGTRVFDFFPGKIPSELVSFFQVARSTVPTYPVELNNRAPQGGAFHENAGFGGNNTAFRSANWFTNNNFSKYRGQVEASNHVFFNVHPQALRKRDVDKFGIERFLAVELEKDINLGNLTFFPFMDDPDVDNPTLGANGPLNSSNTLFEPVLPVSSYGGNFLADCNSLGSFGGLIGNAADGLNTYHSFESNRITERFEEDTRILVEKNFAVGPTATKFGTLGPRLITIEGADGGSRRTITCLADPSREFAFAGHTNSDGFLVYNSFSNGYAEEAIRSLVFRPDLESPPFKENSAPTVDQFEKLIGFSGMIGDIPGVQPGRAVSITSSAQHDSFTFKTTDSDKLQSENSFTTEEQIEEINLPEANSSPLVIPASNSYYGSIKIEYSLTESDQDNGALLLAKVGDEISGIVDGLIIRSNSFFMQIDFRWLRASSFELIGPRVQDMNVSRITMRSIKTDQLNDFLNEQTSHTISFAQSTTDDRLTDRSLFFGTDVVTMSEDEHSNLYIFFNDADGGISTASSNDFGDTWAYYYGIVEKISGSEAINPFAVTNYPSNICYLFFQFGGKILCKKIPFSLFEKRDANLIERFDADRFKPGDEDQFPIEKPSIFSQAGVTLRRGILSYAAAGDLTDNIFREISGKVPGEFEYDPLEQREVDSKIVTVRKNPIAIAPSTAFTNADINSPFFSAYRKDNGELRLWFMGDTQNAGSQLQCRFSVDDGQGWYDLWEFLEFDYNRLRFDSDKETQFIDRTASADVPDNLEGTDPEEGGQEAPFGINVHWSRLKRHKIIPPGKDEGDLVIEDESKTLEIFSPYVFYQSMTDRVFLFYIYEGCLLCKVFNDGIFSDAAKSKSDGAENSGITAVKTIIERQTRSHFIDGSLTSSALREEIHRFPTEEEIMAEGNIIFKYPFAVDSFVDNRSIGAQRVCAYDLPTGLIRVFYKHVDSINLKSALWTGSEWWAEDFLRSPQNVNELDLSDNSDDLIEVTGGFGGEGFGP